MKRGDIGIIGTGNYGLDKITLAIMDELFIMHRTDCEPEIIDPSRIKNQFLTSDKQNDIIKVYKTTSFGMTEPLFRNWYIKSDWRSDLRERNIRSMKNQFVADYVKKSLKELML